MSFLIKLIKNIFSFSFWQMWMPTIIEYILKQKNKPNKEKKFFLIGKTILYFYLIFLTIRMYICALIMFKDKNRFSWFLSFDPIINCVALVFPFFDPFILLAGSFTPLYGLNVDYAIYFQLDKRSNGFFYDYIYKNGENFWQLNKILFNFDNNFVSKIICNIKSCKHIWDCKIEEMSLRFKHQQFCYMPNVSNQLRAKAVVFTFLLSLNIVFSCILFCKCMPGVQWMMI